MKKITIGILAHVDSGKTTLSEALMYCSGNINKLGRVDHKNSLLDNFQLERERGITIFSKQAILKYKDTEFTLLDTPGHIDFSAETERTLQILDYAILVISGTDGIQSHTETLWKLLKRYNIPVFIYVNKMDLDGAYRDKILNQLRFKFGEGCIDFGCDVDKNSFYENVAVCDESLMEKYYENNICDDDIRCLIKKRKIFPCIFGSALKLQNMDGFLESLNNYTFTPKYGNKFGGKVFKISEDKQGNRLTFIKITGGRLLVRDILESNLNKNNEKVTQIRIYSGEKYMSVDTVSAGTVCAVTGITFAHSGDGLGFEKNSKLPILEPVLTYGITLSSEININKAIEKLKILEEEDPQLNIIWNEHIKEIQIQLMGEIQLEVLKTIIKQRFGFNVEFSQGRIIYKETIANTVEGVGHFEPLRHYAEVHLLLQPLRRGSGLIFETDCKEDILEKNWQRLVLTHLAEKTHIGVLTGSPITDMKITLIAGKSHSKHTEGGDFRQATYRAVRNGLAHAESILLEPIYEFTLEIPTENIGRAFSDIQKMSGNAQTPENNGDFSIIKGTAPVSEMRNYHRDVMRYTHGKGKLICTLKGYEPCHNSEEVILQTAYDFENDIENTCDSVFCSHGIGHIVKWNEVQNYMHVLAENGMYTNIKNQDNYTDYEETKLKSKPSLQKYNTVGADFFAQDKELMAIFEKTYGTIKKPIHNEPEKVKRSVTFDKNNKVTKTYSTKYTGVEYLLVDGYNVIFSWQYLREISNESLDTARNALINILCNYQGYSKCELILVFDAYRVKGKHREIEKVNNINVVYTKEAETADSYIEKVTHKLAKNHKVRVVTSDGMEQFIILGNGALRVSSLAFLEEIKQVEKEIKEIISNNH